MKKKESLTVTVPIGTKDALREQAEKEGRSLSSMVAVLLLSGIEERKNRATCSA